MIKIVFPTKGYVPGKCQEIKKKEKKSTLSVNSNNNLPRTKSSLYISQLQYY